MHMLELVSYCISLRVETLIVFILLTTRQQAAYVDEQPLESAERPG
jgi:hypothetical protein